ncbi:HAD family hydrolase [Actinomycetota bacterium Odt1-20B]
MNGAIEALLDGVRCVLWDFDGPICGLFAGHSARTIADEQVRWLRERGLRGLPTDELSGEADPYVVLRVVDHRHPGSDLVTELEERLTQQELKAVRSALPTAYADPLIRTWTATGARLAVTTNNSPLAVADYLETRGLTDCFAPHIYGRLKEDLSLLKPDPHCVHRALNAMGVSPGAALMIGDTPSDHAAARDAGVRFLGYAYSEAKAAKLAAAGARVVVDSLQPVLESVKRGAR